MAAVGGFKRLIRFIDADGKIQYGAPLNEDLKAAKRWSNADPFTGHLTEQVISVKKVLAPIDPPQIICIGLNYRKHAAETGMAIPEHPIVFMKNVRTIQHPNDPVVIPLVAQQHGPEVDYEVELAVVIGKECKDVSEEHALDYVLGYTCANDISARAWQNLMQGRNQWCFSKSFDTFAPLGSVLVNKSEIADPNNLELSLTLNGKIMQKSNTADMIFNVKKLISFLSQGTTLVPGTVILTGTPEGVGVARKPPVFLQDGDKMTVKIQHLGELHNPILFEKKKSKL